MPGHVKSSLCGVSVTLPISDGKPALHADQGLFVCEPRNVGGWGGGHSRTISMVVLPHAVLQTEVGVEVVAGAGLADVTAAVTKVRRAFTPLMCRETQLCRSLAP